MFAKLLVLLGVQAAAAIAAIMAGSRLWLSVRHDKIFCGKVKRPLRVLFFSDLHGNSRRKMNLDIWKKIDDLPGIDLVVIAGDVIINHASELLPHLGGIERLVAKVPVFYIDGNHDVRDYSAVKRLLKRCGVCVLADNKASLLVDGTKVDIIGLRDFAFHRYGGGFVAADAAMRRLDADALNICISHQPQIFDRYTEHSADLMLCGHTHAGQVRLPFMPVLFAPNQGVFPKYGYGWYNVNGARMYVTKGIGTTWFPIRFWNRPEICVIDILPHQ